YIWSSSSTVSPHNYKVAFVVCINPSPKVTSDRCALIHSEVIDELCVNIYREKLKKKKIKKYKYLHFDVSLRVYETNFVKLKSFSLKILNNTKIYFARNTP